MRNRMAWPGADHVQSAGGIGKGHQTNSGFSAQRTAHLLQISRLLSFSAEGESG